MKCSLEFQWTRYVGSYHFLDSQSFFLHPSPDVSSHLFKNRVGHEWEVVRNESTEYLLELEDVTGQRSSEYPLCVSIFPRNLSVIVSILVF